MNEKTKPVGRPTSAEAGTALKAAALSLIREKGYEKVSIADIIRTAGVARQTLYNRWNTKADLVLEAVFDETGRYAAEPISDDDRTCSDQLEAFLIGVFTHLETDGDTLRALIAAAQRDAEFQVAFYAGFVLPRERMVTDLLCRAQERGELSRARDPEMLSAFIHGAFWYRLLNGGSLDAGYARAVVGEIFGG